MNKKVLIISIVVTIVFLLVLYFVYQSGVNSKASNVTITEDVAGTQLSNNDKQYLKGLAINLLNDFDGLNITGHSDSLLNDTSLLSDSKLVALSNIFNEMYESETEETFLQWIKNENFNWDSFTNQTKADTIISRLTSLGVS